MIGSKMQLINPNAKRELGKQAQMNIITASKAVADIVRTTLGPRAMLKMLLDPNGNVVLTNDGASILREIEVKHPAAKMLIELSRTQDERVGDGTTSVVVIAGELIESTRQFLLATMHPTSLAEYFRTAESLCVEYLRKISVPVETTDREKMVELASTTLNTKFVSRFGPLLPALAVDAVTTIAVGEQDTLAVDTKTLVKVEKIPGGDIADCKMVKGVIVEKDILHSAMRRKIEKPKVLLLDCPLEYKKAESETNIEMTKAEDWRRYLELEEQYIRDICAKIRALGPDVLVTEKGVSDLAQHFLLQANVSVLRRVRKSDLHRLAMAVGATVGSQPEKMTSADLGSKCGVFEVRKIGDDYWSFFDDCESPKACSVVLRGASRDVLSEVERNLIDAMGTVRNVLLDPRVLPGGGACELGMAAQLRKQSQPVLAEIATALEVIPRTLLENCGARVNRTMAELRASHEKDGNEFIGVNGKSGELSDMKQLGLWEPLAVKEQMIKTAFGAAAVLVRIDDILSGLSKTKKTSSPMAPMEEE